MQKLIASVAGVGILASSVLAGENALAGGGDAPPASPAATGGQPVGEAPAATAAPAESKDSDVTFQLFTRPTFTFSADLDNNHGSVQVFREDFRASLDLHPAEKLRIGVDLAGEVASYDFSDVRNLAGSNSSPFSDMYETTVVLRGMYSLDDTWSILALGFATAGFESGADFGDSIYGGGAVGVGYKVSDNLWFAVGGGGMTRLERSAIFLPLLQLKWKIDDKLSLATDNLGVKLTDKLSDQWAIYLRGSYEFHIYRLDNGNTVLPGGVTSDQRVPIAFGVEWNACKGLTISLEGGAVVYQEYKFYSSNGAERQDVQTNPAAFIGASLNYRF